MPAHGKNYQNGGERAGLMGGGGFDSSPRDTGHRRRLCLGLTLFSIVLGMVSIMAVAKANLAARLAASQRSDVIAAKALDQLNAHLTHQTKHIAQGCETTLLLFRHCEKHGPNPTSTEDDDSQHCSVLGLERAFYISTLFGPGRRWPTPAHLFALTPDRDDHANFRQWETLHPLATRIQTVVELSSHPALAESFLELLPTGSLCGRVAVVSWKHEFLPELARLLGCGPASGCPEMYDENDYDSVWQLKYVFHAPADEGEEIPASEESDIVLPVNKSLSKKSMSSTTTSTLPPLHHLYQRALKSVSKKGWNVYGTVTNQNFDPLAFSYLVGDYPRKGAATGGRWKNVSALGEL
jgi:hypothetical protein